MKNILILAAACIASCCLFSCNKDKCKPNISAPQIINTSKYGGIVYLNLGISGWVNYVSVNPSGLQCGNGTINQYCCWGKYVYGTFAVYGILTNEFYLWKKTFPSQNPQVQYFIWTPDPLIVNAHYNCSQAQFNNIGIFGFQPQIGDTVTVIKVITNDSDGDYKASQTTARVTIKVENGQIVSTQNPPVENETPEIAANSYVTIKREMIFTANGLYEIIYDLDINNLVDEQNEGDNTVSDKTTNLTTSMD